MTWSKLVELATYLVAHEVIMIVGSFMGLWLLFMTSTGMMILEQKHLQPAALLDYRTACNKADASWRWFWWLIGRRRYGKALRKGLRAAWLDFRALKRLTPVGRVDLIFVRGGLGLAAILVSPDPIKLIILVVEFLRT